MLYYGLKRLPIAEKSRAVSGLKRLRENLSRDIPQKDADNSLLLATWNVRDLTKTKSRRLYEALYFIAEVISRFDFVAVQEVNALEEWEKIMRILGRNWEYIASDEADRIAGGNGERLTYVYDTRKVSFQNIAGELVLPQKMLISQINVELDGKKKIVGRQFARTPYVAMFQSGWFKFSICTVHIYFGKDSGKKLDRRKDEISRVAEYFGEKADDELKRDNRALILLGDFNIVSPDHATMAMLEDQDFTIPDNLRNSPSNQSKTKHYDQIAFRADKELIKFVDQPARAGNPGNSGVFDMYESVFRFEDEIDYAKAKSPDKRSFKTWRSYQMSDHLPMWVRIDVNNADEYIDGIV